ncbi:hypothetical protein ACHAWF_004047 [Thalassiosira exigua]
MEKPPATAAAVAGAEPATSKPGEIPAPARDDRPPSPSPPASAAAASDPPIAPPLSKNQLKKRRRYEKALAIKKRRKEQSKEVRRLKAERDGRDLDAERAAQLKNEREGAGWKKREEKWLQIVKEKDVAGAFRVCFDCSFEEKMTSKESNSLSLQLRYAYATNRRSTAPVYIDVCGVKPGSLTWEGLAKVEGFPERWVGRAFRCYGDNLEEVYAGNSRAYGDDRGEDKPEAKEGAPDASREEIADAAVPSDSCQNTSDGNTGKNEATKVEGGDCIPIDDTNEINDSKPDDLTKPEEATKASESDYATKATQSENGGNCEKSDAASDNPNKSANGKAGAGGETSHPPPRPKRKLVYLTGDSPNTLTTLDDDATYVVGGIVDRNRFKRIALDRAEALRSRRPALNVETARLPLEENFDFRGSTRILTCNHVFEILLKYRENGYDDWTGAISAVLPGRKEVEEKGDGGGGRSGGA